MTRLSDSGSLRALRPSSEICTDLELARAFATTPTSPEGSIFFMFGKVQRHSSVM